MPDYYVVERVVAKKKIQGKWEYLVKWKDYSSEQMTWEPASHLPEIAITTFEAPPTFDPEWVCESCERLVLILERGLKTSATTVVTVEFGPEFLRYLFPCLPSDLSSSRYFATVQDFVAAGLGDFLERVVTVNGGKRHMMFPVVKGKRRSTSIKIIKKGQDQLQQELLDSWFSTLHKSNGSFQSHQIR